MQVVAEEPCWQGRPERNLAPTQSRRRTCADFLPPHLLLELQVAFCGMA